MDTYDYLFKILMVGNSGVGKSCILTQLTEKTYNETYISTIGVDFKIYTINVDGRVVKLQLWDTAGQERFRTITSGYYRGAHGIVLVYDVTNRESFLDIEKWQKEIEKYAKSNVIRILIGNKCDLMEKREVSEQEGRELANQMFISFIETSAKLSKNVSEVFVKMSREIAEIEPPIAQNAQKSSISLTSTRVPDQNYCCL